MKRRCEDPLISQTLGFDTYRMGNCIKTDNESKYKIEELTKGKISTIVGHEKMAKVSLEFILFFRYFRFFCIELKVKPFRILERTL